jgi:hypothetical protein
MGFRGRAVVLRALVSTRSWRVLAVLVALVSCGFLGAEGAWGASTKRFAKPGRYSYKVPAGVRRITVTAVGAGGGNCDPGHGGKGAEIKAMVRVKPGQDLVVVVGGHGEGCHKVPASGGFGGGGAGGAGNHSLGSHGAGGGGASFVLPRKSAFRQALVVAGGGGGSTDYSPTVGVNGGNAGSPGEDGAVAGSGGRAGGKSAGGAGGRAQGPSAHAGFAGSLRTGGAGGHGARTGVSVGGGGGGGGYYGGGGGGGGASPGPFFNFSTSAFTLSPGAGGGGSSRVVAGATRVSRPKPTSGHPKVIITPR